MVFGGIEVLWLSSRWRLRRGVHPVISEVILVAITIAIAIAAVSWLLGVWQFEQESFAVTPVLYVKGAGNSNGDVPELYLHFANSGSKEVNIIKIEVVAGSGSWVNSSQITIPPGSSIDYTIDDWVWQGSGDPPDLYPGIKMRVIIYTERMGSYITDVYVKQGS